MKSLSMIQQLGIILLTLFAVIIIADPIAAPISKYSFERIYEAYSYGFSTLQSIQSTISFENTIIPTDTSVITLRALQPSCYLLMNHDKYYQYRNPHTIKPFITISSSRIELQLECTLSSDDELLTCPLPIIGTESSWFDSKFKIEFNTALLKRNNDTFETEKCQVSDVLQYDIPGILPEPVTTTDDDIYPLSIIYDVTATGEFAEIDWAKIIVSDLYRTSNSTDYNYEYGSLGINFNLRNQTLPINIPPENNHDAATDGNNTIIKINPTRWNNNYWSPEKNNTILVYQDGTYFTTLQSSRTGDILNIEFTREQLPGGHLYQFLFQGLHLISPTPRVWNENLPLGGIVAVTCQDWGINEHSTNAFVAEYLKTGNEGFNAGWNAVIAIWSILAGIMVLLAVGSIVVYCAPQLIKPIPKQDGVEMVDQAQP